MLWWLAQNTLVAAALAGVVALACRWLRLGPAARHALWVVVLVKLITPPLVVWPWTVGWPAEQRAASAARVIAPPAPIHSPVEERPAAERVPSVPATRPAPLPVSESLPLADTQPVPPRVSKRTADPASEAAPPTAAPSAVDWLALLTWVWAGGSLLMILLQWKRIRNMQAVVAASTQAPAWLARDVAGWAEKLRIRAPTVRVTPQVTSPMVWGLGRPVLLWPAALADENNAGRWPGVLVHELAHVRRRDHWVGWLELLAGCLWWPNPLFWYVRHQIRENAELSCDAWVLDALPEGRRAYAEALLNVCEFARQTAPLPAVGVGGGTRRALERRLTMILKDRVPFRLSRWSLVAVTLLAVLTLPSWTQSQDTDKAGSNNPFDENPPYRPAAGNPFDRADGATGEELPRTYPNDRRAPNRASGFAYPEENSQSPGRAPLKAGGFQPAYNTNPAVGQTADSPPEIAGTDGPLTHAAVASAKETIANLSPQQLAALEQQLGQMLQAVQALRGQESADGYDSKPLKDYGHVVATSTFTLTKTIYSLPDEKGQALQSFLGAHVGEPQLLRITRDGKDELTVVASPKAQQAIGELILLMKNSPAPSLPTADSSEAEDFGAEAVDDLVPPPGIPIPR